MPGEPMMGMGMMMGTRTRTRTRTRNYKAELWFIAELQYYGMSILKNTVCGQLGIDQYMRKKYSMSQIFR